MANYNDLITAIDSVIKTNNRREITGQLLQNVLNTMVGSLGENYQLAGFATPTTNPHQPDQNVFYVASQAGVYTQFDNIVLGDGISFLMWKNGAWTSQTISMVTQSWVQQNYVSKEWFRKVFRVYDENGLEIVPNDMDSVVDNIKAMVGLWTNEYLSALGMGRDGGGTTQTLAQLNDVQLGTLANGDALVYNTAIHKWENKQIQTGVDMSVVWAALAANTNEQINASHLATALSSYVTSANLSTMLNDYATKAWAGQNFITVEWFDKLFHLYNGTETEANKIAPNGALPVDRTNLNIEAMFGFWTKKYISALGQGDDGTTSYTTLAQLNDVTLTNLTADQVLTYDGTHWVNRTLSLGSQTLTGLSDVAITTPSANQMLSYDVTTQKWVNVAIPATGVTSVATGTGLTGGTITTSGTISINSTYQTYISHGESAYGWGNHANVGYLKVGSDGVLEVGQFIDFHKNGTTSDYSVRLQVLSNNGNDITLPSSSGTLALTSQLDSYLPLSGGTMSGGIAFNLLNSNNTITFGGGEHLDNYGNVYLAANSGSWNVLTPNGGVLLKLVHSTTYCGVGISDPSEKLHVNGNIKTSTSDGTFVQIGNIRLVYDSSNNAIKVIKSDGTNANLYATGGVSAFGASQESGGGGNYLPLSGGTMSGTINITTSSRDIIRAIDSTFSKYVFATSASGGEYAAIHGFNHPTLYTTGGSLNLAGERGISIGDWDDPTMFIQSSNGNVGIGTSSPTYKLTVEGSILASGGIEGDVFHGKALELSFSTPFIDFHYNNSTADFTSRIIEYSAGTLTCEANLRAFSYANTSDIRLKNKIKDVEIPIEIIARAPAFQFTWKNPKMGGGYHIGTSAQYWQSAVSEFVDVEKDEMGTLSMQYGVAALISAITISRKVMTHEEKIALLETRVSALEKENGEQEMLINSLQEELAKLKAA